MIETLLHKLLKYGSDEDVTRAANILSVTLTDLQYSELMKLDAELDDVIAELNEPPDEEELLMKFPSICEGCEE